VGYVLDHLVRDSHIDHLLPVIQDLRQFPLHELLGLLLPLLQQQLGTFHRLLDLHLHLGIHRDDLDPTLVLFEDEFVVAIEAVAEKDPTFLHCLVVDIGDHPFCDSLFLELLTKALKRA
jgi:hypothetical protein